MNRCVIDTNILLHLNTGHPAVNRNAKRHRNRFGTLYLTTISCYEVYKGWRFKVFAKDAKSRRFARRKLLDFAVFLNQNELLHLTHESVQIAADIQVARRRQGNRPNDHMDYLIAGIALANGFHLVTHNVADFAGIEGLTIENWFE